MQLTIAELLAYTDEERAKWQRWFAAHGDEPLKLALAGETHTSLGALIMHIFWAEGFYAYWLRGEVLSQDSTVVKENQARPNDQAAAVFGLGEITRAAMRAFTGSASAEDWERAYELAVPELHFQGSARKLIAHILIHEIRHWAQVAIIIRQNGLTPPGDHDLVFSPSFGPLARRISNPD
ncbi:MAG: hypothetical protein HYR56_20835 [Acidobacteria bacterium]|nr:hypothetical protein [Acidobacteriota bacterium]MBI3425106.1 hypothetical protein [Acidobacteriota bacterium]